MENLKGLGLGEKRLISLLIHLISIIKIENNNTKDKQTSGVSLALDEDSPFTNSCLFTLDRLPLLLLLRKN